MSKDKTTLIGYSLDELQNFSIKYGEAPYRGNQVFNSLYIHNATSFDDLTTLSKPLRNKISDQFSLELPIELVLFQQSKIDETIKFLFKLEDNNFIETVLIPSTKFEEETRLTLCVSTQVGCPLDCKFCATGTMGFKKNLSVGEIISQIIFVKRFLKKENFSFGKKITNIVFMGMGEPFLNYNNLIKSIEIITNGFNITAKKITVSTVGYADKIIMFSKEKIKPKLAISLHSLNDDLRNELMPINKKFPLTELIDATKIYQFNSRHRITFEYILFDNLNDTKEDINNLVKLSNEINCKINLIPYHSIEFTNVENEFQKKLKPSSKEKMNNFANSLREQNVAVFVRSSSGEDINAACGQLAISNKNN